MDNRQLVTPAPSPPVQTENQTQQSQQQTGQSFQGYNYAGFWIRYAAYVIDILVVDIPIVVVLIVFFIMLASSKPFALVVAVTLVVTILLVVSSYAVVMTYKYGATLGKMAMKLKVISANGQQLTLSQVIRREMLDKYLSGFFFSFGYLMVAFSKKKQGLHDHLAGTYVIQTQPVTRVIKFVIFLTTLAPVLFIILVIAASVLFEILLGGGAKKIQTSIPYFGSRLVQARDAYRKSDVSVTALSLKDYYTLHKDYPQDLSELVKTGRLKTLPTPQPYSILGYATCLYQGFKQAIVYTKLEDNGHYWVFRTTTLRAEDSGSLTPPSCP